jgi:single-strand DNA-binding protein
MNLNKVFILGRLTHDPQARSLPSGDTVVNFGIATNRVFYNKNKEKQEQAEFHNVVLFGKIADIAQQYLKQGAMVLIEGRLQTRSWEDKDGIKKYRTEIIGENLQMGPRLQQGEQNMQQKKSSQKEGNQEDIPTIEEEIDVKDLPL